jgi:hypothetical protein
MSATSRGVRLVAAVALVSTLVLGARTTPARASTSAADAARLALASQDLWVGPTGTVTAILTLHGVQAGSTLAPIVYGAVPTRSAFALTMKGEALPGSGQALERHRVAAGDGMVTVRFRVGDGTATPDETAPPGDIVTWTEPGVHPIAFTLAAPDGSTSDTVISYVVRLAAEPTEGKPTQLPLRVATELRLDAPPPADGPGRPEVAPDARRNAAALVDGLSGLADAPEVSSGFAFAVTPELADSLARSGRSSDRALLSRIDDLTRDRELQSLPWVPINLARWLVTDGLRDHATRVLAIGDDATERLLHAPDRSVADLPAWPGSPSDAQVAWLADRGATGVLVPEDELSPLDASAFPRSLAAPFSLDYGQGRKVTAVQLDTALSAHFAADDPVLGANQLLADLAVMALDLPAISRGVVVAPPKGWDPSAAFLGAYVDDLTGAAPAGAVPLLATASVEDVLTKVPAARVAGDMATQGDALVRTLRADPTPKPLDALARELDRTQAMIVSLSSMAPGGAARSAVTAAALTRRVDTAASADLGSAERARRLAAVRSTVDDLVGTVRMPASQTITLTSDTADIPLSIHRSAAGPTLIRLHFDANTRLTFDKGTSQLVHLTDTTTQLRVRVRSDSPGDSVVQVTATSPNGTLLVGTSKLVVRSTAASGMGLLISFGSLAFLLVWWVRDIVRVRRRRRAGRVRPADLIDV